MPFDDPQEQEDETLMQPYRLRPMYPDSGQTELADDDQTSDLPTWLSLSSQQFPPSDGQFQRRFGDPLQAIPKPSIGQRILASGQQRTPFDADVNGTTVAANGTGQNVIAGAKQSMDSWQAPRLRLRGASPAGADFGRAQGQPGLFSTFVPASADTALDLPRESSEQSRFGSSPYAISGRPDEPALSFPGTQRPKTSTATSPKGARGAAATKGGNALRDASGHGQQKEGAKQQGKPPQTEQLPDLQLPSLLQTDQGPPKPALFSSASEAAKHPPDPSWTEIREYIAQEAKAYGIPVKLAEAVVRHETNFNIHSDVEVRNKKGGKSHDYGIMAVNSSNTDRLTGPEGWGFQIDTKRVQNDWKYNVHVGMAILKKAYAAAAFNNVGEENIARETYARYNAHKLWRQLYTVPKGHIAQHVDQFMKSWHKYYDDK